MVVTQKKLGKVLLKHDGNTARASKELGVSQEAINKRLRHNPQLKKAILNVREEALKKAGLSRAFVYKGIKEGCKAKVVSTIEGIPTQTNIADHGERHKFLKTALELHKDLDPDKEQSVLNIGSVIFNLLSNTKRQAIDVV